MIIVEGPDGAGKSTTLQKLKYTRMHLKSLRGGVGGNVEGAAEGWATCHMPAAAYARKVREVEQIVGRRVGIDRFHLSEAVYGPLLRNEQLIDEGTMRLITHMLRDKQIPVILCLPPFEVTLANVMQEGRPRPEYQTETFLRLAYEEFEKLAPWATLVYDYTKDPLPGFVDQPISHVNGD